MAITATFLWLVGDWINQLPMADPDLGLRGGPCFVLLALPTFLPSVISSIFIQNKGRGWALWASPLDQVLGSSVYLVGPPSFL